MKKKKMIINSTTNDYEIYCNLFLPDNLEEKNISNYIIACHGFGGDKDSSAILLLAESMTKNKYAVISFDFPGHGESRDSGEKFLVTNSIQDIIDVETYLKNINQNAKISFFGTSYGAYCILLKIGSNSEKYESVVLRCPAINMSKIFKSSILNCSLEKLKDNGYTILGYERKLKVTYDYYKELEKNDIFKKYNGESKILIIHGTKDDIAPITDSIIFQEKFNKNVELIKIEGADHRFKKEGEIEKVIEEAEKYYMRKYKY